MNDEKVRVHPVLVRDYQRLLSLFPYSYRRDHQAELLGHLVEASEPEQSRVSSGERFDLLRAAGREWLLAPVGSTALQRRHGTSSLLIFLPILLFLPAAAALGSIVATLQFDGSLRHAVEGTPLAPAWLLWLVGFVVLALGFLRTARAFLTVAAAVSWGTLIVLGGRGEMQEAFIVAGWVLGQTACAMVVAERVAWSRTLQSPVWKRVTVLAVAGVVALPTAWIVQGLSYGTGPWGYRPGFRYALGTNGVLLLLGLALVVLLCSRRTRQSIPVLAGIATAVTVGRTGIFGSRFRPLDVVDFGNVIGLFAVSIVAMAGVRWVINRMDELSSARIRLSSTAAGLTATVAVLAGALLAPSWTGNDLGPHWVAGVLTDAPVRTEPELIAFLQSGEPKTATVDATTGELDSVFVDAVPTAKDEWANSSSPTGWISSTRTTPDDGSAL
ncbi:hypothetical protein [Krasilnikoviella flava]|uniref:Uncharacterized protein n=1 Tax=Krasilnikoviella flava TaxID=526729 RepID=A0A1T5IDY5_9MICO|nr:hypothetical protein [Krasilnikoviella flava]SKC37369.1 hypothetical protein SAMN04324258_0396 [Krasilnikoviella flava]